MTNHFEELISAEQLLQLYQKKKIVIFDCRFYLEDPSKGRKEYLNSHIPGAVYLDLNHDLSSPVIKGITGRHPLPHHDVLAATLRSAGLENENQVVVYDQSNGFYAVRAWWLLRWLGHEHVAVLDGGFSAWNKINGPIDNEWPLPSQGNFKINLRDDLIIEKEEVNKLKDSLVDSREYKRYTGEFEPIDPVAGHIPGALCLPFHDNTDAGGHWRPKDELKEKFEELSEIESPVFYCGSGVTACHNILAYKIATGKESRLYPGSWSEWINYNKLPFTP